SQGSWSNSCDPIGTIGNGGGEIVINAGSIAITGTITVSGTAGTESSGDGGGGTIVLHTSDLNQGSGETLDYSGNSVGGTYSTGGPGALIIQH
ncbi:MAG: hypothetical protein M1318_07790, partial [Firmicutes bacterium]|nr:hypothetical protein [Bacillota bacterium]